MLTSIYQYLPMIIQALWCSAIRYSESSHVSQAPKAVRYDSQVSESHRGHSSLPPQVLAMKGLPPSQKEERGLDLKQKYLGHQRPPLGERPEKRDSQAVSELLIFGLCHQRLLLHKHDINDWFLLGYGCGELFIMVVHGYGWWLTTANELLKVTKTNHQERLVPVGRGSPKLVHDAWCVAVLADW